MDDIIECARIGVDCIENTIDNIKNGEPKYIGFVFIVKREEADYMIKFIEETLKKYNVPFEDVYVYNSISLPIIYLWDKEKIVTTIAKNAEKIIEMSSSKTR